MADIRDQNANSGLLTASGSLTATNQAVTFTLTGQSNATFQLTGTWSATVTFEASNDNSNWTTIYSFRAGDSVISSTATANDIYRCTVAGFGFVRARCSAYTSGTIVVTALAAWATSGVFQNFPQVLEARSSLPTPATSGNGETFIGDLFGRALVSHIDPGMQTWKSANYTSTQTGAAIWTPASGKKIAVTYLAISSYGTTSARAILWFGASGDTTYSAGTDQLVWAGSFAPTASSKPGAVIQPFSPIFSSTVDHLLRITTDAALSVDVTVYGYEF